MRSGTAGSCSLSSLRSRSARAAAISSKLQYWQSSLSAGGEHDHLIEFLSRKRQPARKRRIEPALQARVDRHVQQRTGGSHEDSVRADRVDAPSATSVAFASRIRQPDVSPVHDAERSSLCRPVARRAPASWSGARDQVEVQAGRPADRAQARGCRPGRQSTSSASASPGTSAIARTHCGYACSPTAQVRARAPAHRSAPRVHACSRQALAGPSRIRASMRGSSSVTSHPDVAACRAATA